MKLSAVAVALATVCCASASALDAAADFRKGPSGDDPSSYIKRQYGIGVSDCDFFSATNLPALNMAGYGYNSVTGKRSDQPVLKTTEYGKMIAVQGYGAIINSENPAVSSRTQCFRIPDAFAGKDGLGIAFSDNKFQSTFDTVTTTSLGELSAAQAAKSMNNNAYYQSEAAAISVQAKAQLNSSSSSTKQTEEWNTVNRLITDENGVSKSLDSSIVAAGALAFGTRSDMAHLTSEVYNGGVTSSLDSNLQKFVSVSTIAGHYYSASILNFRLTNRFVHGLLELEELFREHNYDLIKDKDKHYPHAVLAEEKEEAPPAPPNNNNPNPKYNNPPPKNEPDYGKLNTAIKAFFNKFGDRYYKSIKVGGKFNIVRSSEFKLETAKQKKNKENINTCVNAVTTSNFLKADAEIHVSAEKERDTYGWENDEYEHAHGREDHDHEEYDRYAKHPRYNPHKSRYLAEDNKPPKPKEEYADVYEDDEEFYGDETAEQSEKETSRKKVFAFDLKGSVDYADQYSQFSSCSSALKSDSSFANSLSKFMASCKSYCEGGADLCPSCNAGDTSSAAFTRWLDGLREAPSIVNPEFGRVDKLIERYAAEPRFTKYFHNYDRFVVAFKEALLIYYKSANYCSDESYYNDDPACKNSKYGQWAREEDITYDKDIAKQPLKDARKENERMYDEQEKLHETAAKRVDKIDTKMPEHLNQPAAKEFETQKPDTTVPDANKIVDGKVVPSIVGALPKKLVVLSTDDEDTVERPDLEALNLAQLRTSRKERKSRRGGLRKTATIHW